MSLHIWLIALTGLRWDSFSCLISVRDAASYLVTFKTGLSAWSLLTRGALKIEDI